MRTEHSSLFIDNLWRQGSGHLFASFDPATGEKIWEGRGASLDDVKDAVQSASAAFESWSNKSIEDRKGYLRAFQNAVKESKPFLAESISKETGKPLWDSLGEAESMIHKVDISFDAYDKRCAGKVFKREKGEMILRHRPHGVVAVLGPYNFPAHLPNGHIIPALFAGNTVIFKPSEFTPLVAEEMIRLWHEAGLPAGVLNLIQGGKETGQALVHHPSVDGLFFTGSYSVGVLLSEAFALHPGKILALEMGGNNPLVVGEISNIEKAANAIIHSAYLSSGQRCTCARRLILTHGPSGDQLLTILSEMTAALNIGPWTQTPEPFMGPVISEYHAKKIFEAEEKLIKQGGHPLVKMALMQANTGFISPGLMDVTSIIGRSDEEIFGPFLQVIRVEGFEEALQEANRTKFGLTAGLLSEQREQYDYFYRKIKTGIVNWNTPLTGASSALPFGGIKCSGNHRPSAYYAADYCSYPVSSHESSSI